MFNLISPTEPDQILSLMASYRNDPRSSKLDLGVGVYRDNYGRTPVMSSIRIAEKEFAEHQASKAYLGIDGNFLYNKALVQLVFGAFKGQNRIRSCQTPGGSGAIRILADMLGNVKPGAAIWLPDPTWPNHRLLLAASGLEIKYYPYLSSKTGDVSFEGILTTLSKAKPGDIVLLHGCCHNPSGADFSRDQWRDLVKVLNNFGLFPLIDLAYQGFGDGLEEDAFGVRLLAENLPEMAVAVSSSKTFGVYCDRVGAAMVMGQDPASADLALESLKFQARATYSMPPNNGAAVVAQVLTDPLLQDQWSRELGDMRNRITGLRKHLVTALRNKFQTSEFDYLGCRKGMFSQLNLTPDQVDQIRTDHGVYMVADGRINMAGLTERGAEKLADALFRVIAAS